MKKNKEQLLKKRNAELKKQLARKMHELKIEAALEKVRARTMAMRKSDELRETTYLLFQQLKKLGETASQVSIGVINEQTGYVELSATVHGDPMPQTYYVPATEPYVMKKVVKAWKEKRKSVRIVIRGKELKDYNKWRNTVLKKKIVFPEKQWVVNVIFFSKGMLSFSSDKEISKETVQLLERFAAVFDLTYTRFLDLKKAEAQARESQIDAALERIRAASMAMHKSDELVHVVELIDKEIAGLGIVVDNSSIITDFSEPERGVNNWLARKGARFLEKFHIPFLDHSIFTKFYDAITQGVDYYSENLSKSEKNKYFRLLFKHSDFRKLPGERQQYIYSTPGWTRAIVVSKNSFLLFQRYNLTEFTKDEEEIFKRFGKVFEQTYTRFLDLQKAEAQAREAQIEAALERVRSRTMAMHKTSELQEVIHTVHHELLNLNLSIDGGSFVVINKDVDPELRCWGSGGTANTSEEVLVPHFNMPFCTNLMIGIKKGPGFFTEEFSQKEKKEFFTKLFKQKPWSDLSSEQKKATLSSPGGYTRSVAVSKHTSIFIINHQGRKFTDAENEILKRFAKVFEQTYTRFLDLQKAEAQAREAQIQLALERVRARTMAMQRSEELSETAYVLFQQFVQLGENPIQITIGIIKEEERIMEFRVTDWGGSGSKVNIGFDVSIDEPTLINKIFKAWKKNESSIVIELTGAELEGWLSYRNKVSGVNVKSTDTAGRRIISVAFFSKGMIAFSSPLPPVQESIAILERFANVFDLTYTRFLDLKKAEAQAREAQIEIGLERVRSRAMAMQSSEELNALIGTVFTELTKLDLALTRCIIWVFESATNAARWWMANSEEPSNPMSFFIKYHEHPAYLTFVKEWKNQNVKFVYDLKGKDKIKWDKILFNETELKNLPDVVKNGMQAPERVLLSASFNNFGGINVASLEPLSDEHFDILLRFAKVFDLTYTRFLDLQKAEAQAREARIEAALERVRAKAMAMHNSEDVTSATVTMFTELEKLGVENFRCGINHLKTDRTQEVWSVTNSDGGKTLIAAGSFQVDAHPFWKLMHKEWIDKKEYLQYHLAGKEKEDYVSILNATPNYLAQPIKEFPDIYFQVYFFGEGSVWAMSLQPHPEEVKQIMKRFASVFSLTFRRYQDLLKAEAQAREAQIEAALERVRSKSMAMHSSQDIAETVDILFHELTKLHVETLRCGISIIHDTKEMDVWTANPDADGKSSLTIGTLPMSIYPSLEELFDAWKNKESHFVYDLSGDDLINYFTAINNAPDYPIRYDISKLPPRQVINCFLFSEGALFAFTTELLTGEAITIFKRFATLFGQTYRRYLDLQKAEILAKEATIEAALEKVRGKAMAMHNSSDLSTTASTVFTELRKLGISPIRCGVGLLTKESRKAQLYSATSSSSGDSLSLVGWAQLENHPVLEQIYDTWLQQKDYFPELQSEQLRSYYKLLLAGISVPVPDFSNEQKQFGCFISFSIGCLYAWSDVKYTEDELKILRRFATIIELTFRRYLELQQLEANAKEAVKQAALDRIRADIASMRTLGDLNRIIPLIWNELTILGLPFIRCGVFLMDDSQKLIHTFLSTPEGKAIAAFHIPYDTPGKIRLIPENWKNKTRYIDHWNDSDFIEFANTLVKQHVIESSDQYLSSIPHGGFYLHFVPFLQGMMYVGNTLQLSEDDLTLIQSVSDAFSTAYARYEDFNKLEAAKKQVDSTLNDLQTTQKQLIQSEKMASLGELTAGIAHEIQNPLNFVNNFSDVSTELLQEMKQELATGNLQQATELADDVIQNLEKILLHGKRADGIVKSMLQHSRASSGKKEPTDINALCDEYLRLSFHGLRAKDKTFNAKFETDLDPTIGKINIVGQDIGRVILNLINNAFYAVSEKKKKSDASYEPTVTVTTKNLGNNIEVRVKDNGAGMPQKILDKIFQPFFTTKPTGQGTGLGLSLSYDIITKGHGGELKVETKEGEGTEFIIQLPV